MVATGVAGLVIGLVTGLVLGSDEFEPSAAGQEISVLLTSAAGSLEVAAVEYGESVSDGEVIEQAEYDGALAAVASSRTKFTEVAPALEPLGATTLDSIDDLYQEIDASMRSHADPEVVTELIERLEEILKGDG